MGAILRTFELTAHVEAISRGERGGHRSATAAAAYRACCVIDCEREGKTHDYTRKQGLEVSAIVLPAGAPERFNDRATLWNAAEMRERNGKRGARAGAFKQDAQVAREVLFTFPAELSAAGRQAAAQCIARHLVEAHGVAADYSLHLPGRDGDQQNFHCHLMMTTRRLTANGLGEKVREWSNLYEGRERTRGVRAFIAATLNDQLRQEGKADLVHVEHRSFATRGMVQQPTRHQGPARMNGQRKAQTRLREAWTQQHRTEQRDRHGTELASLGMRQEIGMQTKRADLAQRGREGAQAIKRELDRQRRQDPKPDRMRRVILAVTGRAARDASDRQMRERQRLTIAREKLATLKTELRQERASYAEGQTRERAQLVERHRGEDRQLRQAVVSRESLDQSADRQLQRAQRRERSQEQNRMQQRTQEQTRQRTRSGPEFTP